MRLGSYSYSWMTCAIAGNVALEITANSNAAVMECLRREFIGGWLHSRHGSPVQSNPPFAVPDSPRAWWAQVFLDRRMGRLHPPAARRDSLVRDARVVPGIRSPSAVTRRSRCRRDNSSPGSRAD